MKELGSRYLFICLYVWLEKYFAAEIIGAFQSNYSPSLRIVAVQMGEGSRRAELLPAVLILGMVLCICTTTGELRDLCQRGAQQSV